MQPANLAGLLWESLNHPTPQAVSVAVALDLLGMVDEVE